MTLKSIVGLQPFGLSLFLPQNMITMNKGTHFSRTADVRPAYKFTRQSANSSYQSRKRWRTLRQAPFDAWQHLVVMLYAVVKRFDSLREIVASMLPEARKLGHLGINAMPRRSTLSDANLRRNEYIFEAIYREAVRHL